MIIFSKAREQHGKLMEKRMLADGPKKDKPGKPFDKFTGHQHGSGGAS